ncbi:MAG: hypothetical protein JXR84_13665 [Anaerolineae bacterium]|nr:hypothetical protein [Anaerolineae bacterium]
MSILLLLFLVVGLIGLAMLVAGVILVLQGSEQETRRLVGIVLLVLGLLVACTPVVIFILMRLFMR